MTIPTLPDVSSRHGAPMGRRSQHAEDPADVPALLVMRLRFEDGDYDSAGSYWGSGDPIWWATSDDHGVSAFYRASDKAEAERQLREDGYANATLTFIEESPASNLGVETPIHVDHELGVEQIPRQCIEECSASGDVSGAVANWRVMLGFTVNRTRAIDCLKGCGAWERDELDGMSDEEVAERILWVACCTFSEFLTWRDDEPDVDAKDCPCGSDFFCME